MKMEEGLSRSLSLIIHVLLCMRHVSAGSDLAGQAINQLKYETSSSSPDWGTLESSTISSSTSCEETHLYANKNWEEVEDYTSVDIAIIGAGPAGLATAIGLSRSLPADSAVKIRIYERAPEIRKASQGMLSLWPNGISSLARIHPDLPRLMKSEGCPMERTVIASIDGATGSESIILDTGSENISRGINDMPFATLIRWQAMHAVLAKLLLDDNDGEAMVVTGHSLLTYKEVEGADKDDAVFLRFENGNIVRAKIVIGADGTFSSVRKTMHPSDRPIYFGQMNWNAIVPTDTLPEDARPPINGVKMISYDGDGDSDSNKDSVRWSVYINDCGANHTFFQLRITDMEKAKALSGSKGRGGLGLPGVKAALLPVVKMSTHTSNVLNALPDELIFERAIIGRLPASTWLSPGGRVVLLGDCAHAMHPLLGQGANQAFGSTAALVEGITSSYKNHVDEGKNNDDLSWLVNGLESYDRNRRPRMDWFHRYVNMAGCGQSSGEATSRPELDQQTKALWSKWFKTEDHVPPPLEGRHLVETFDPLSILEVSLV